MLGSAWSPCSFLLFLKPAPNNVLDERDEQDQVREFEPTAPLNSSCEAGIQPVPELLIYREMLPFVYREGLHQGA